jgi:hypothetical protein
MALLLLRQSFHLAVDKGGSRDTLALRGGHMRPATDDGWHLLVPSFGMQLKRVPAARGRRQQNASGHMGAELADKSEDCEVTPQRRAWLEALWQ